MARVFLKYFAGYFGADSGGADENGADGCGWDFRAGDFMTQPTEKKRGRTFMSYASQLHQNATRATFNFPHW